MLDVSEINMQQLFLQLGLDDSEEGRELFISRFSPMPSDVNLEDAEFWDPDQAAFIKEAIEQDAEWARVVDQLNTILRK